MRLCLETNNKVLIIFGIKEKLEIRFSFLYRSLIFIATPIVRAGALCADIAESQGSALCSGLSVIFEFSVEEKNGSSFSSVVVDVSKKCL